MSSLPLKGHERGEILLSLFSAGERAALERDPEVVQALAALAAHSPALTQALAIRPELARWLFWSRSYQLPAEEGTLSAELAGFIQGAEELRALEKGLRLFRLRELARLAVRDLMGLADLSEVVRTLTRVAEVCLEQSLGFAVKKAVERYGLPRGLPGLKPVVLGMGKLGAGELNYASDVDLIYLYEADREARLGPGPAVVADFVFTLLTRAMSELTEDGLVFRVDLDLRPGGKDGPQAQAVDQALNHYLNLGQPWERMALLKARPVAGDRKAGERFLEALLPFIYRRHLDYMALEELKALKARIARENRQGRRQALPHGAAIDVKLAPGGIREVEFFAQALTLTFGGRLAHLRRSDTLGALAALAGEGVISSQEAGELSQAYTFLRTVEHRVQIRDLTQTHVLSLNDGVLERTAASMPGYVQEPGWFLAALQAHMRRIGALFSLLLRESGDEGAALSEGPASQVRALLDHLGEEEPSLRLLEGLGFQRPDAAWAACQGMRALCDLPDSRSRYRQPLERLLPRLIAEAAASPDPNRALLHMERFLARIGPMGSFILLLEENPNLVHLLSLLFGTSEYLSRILIQHPGTLDGLIDRRSARRTKDRAALAGDLETALLSEADPETRLGLTRRFKNDELLRIGLFDVLGELTFHELEEQLTLLAEAVMASTLALAVELVPSAAGLPLMVVGLGKIGGRELSYGSDLDLIFVLGGRKGAAMETAVKVVQRFINFLSAPLSEGPGYDIDSRLRPSGTFGPLVVTPASFARYHQTSQLWERQALLKLRPLLGPPALGRQMKTLANRAIWGRPLPEDAAGQIARLKERMARERGRLKPGAINFKFSPGGLVEAEFLTQYLQLVHGAEATGGVRLPSTLKALAALGRRGLGPARLKDVAVAYALLGRVSARLRLVHGRGGDEAAFTEAEVAALDLPGLEPDPLEAVRHAREAIESAYGKIFLSEVVDDGQRA